MGKKLAVVFFILAIILVAICGIYFVSSKHSGENIKEACINGTCFDVEIADSDEERQTGLMYRDNLPLNSGMLFIFDSSEKHAFWMKNTYISLDLIWIDEDKKVVSIKKGAEPCLEERCDSFMPHKDARYVLEVNSGYAIVLGIEEGDEVEFK